MAYCRNCGAPIDPNAAVCLQCGCAQNPQAGKPPIEDNGGFLWGLLGAFIPLVGLILFIIWKDEKPKTSKAAGIGAIVGVAFSIIISILIGIIFPLLAMTYLITLQ